VEGKEPRSPTFAKPACRQAGLQRAGKTPRTKEATIIKAPKNNQASKLKKTPSPPEIIRRRTWCFFIGTYL